MDRYFTKTFTRFLIAFLLIIVAAMGILFVAARNASGLNPIDNVAQPR